MSKVLFRLRQSTAAFAEPEVRELRQSVALGIAQTVSSESTKETSDRAMRSISSWEIRYCGV